MGFLSNDRSTLQLSTTDLSHLIADNDKCRFVVDFVSRLDLSSLYGSYKSQGGDAYDPAILLATWFYAYSEGIDSTRVLEKLCKRDLCYIYVSAHLTPDHCALSRFRRRHLELLPLYFEQLLQMALDQSLSDFGEINIDGSKIKASASKKRSKNAEQLERLLEKTRQSIDSYLQRCESEDTQGDEQDLEALRREKDRLEQFEEKILQSQQDLQIRQSTLKPEYREAHKINFTDPDARMMASIKAPGYNAQAAVDSSSYLIVATDVVCEANDTQQFAPMHQRTETLLPEDPQRRYNMDAGYHSFEQFEYIDQHHIDAVIADPKRENRANPIAPTPLEELLQNDQKIERSDFFFDAQNDVYQCPNGQKLSFQRHFKRGKTYGQTYQASSCENCPLEKRCLPPKNRSGVKQIHRQEREPLAEAMRDKLQTPEAKQRLKTRMTTVEPVFGNLKANLGFTSFRLRGEKQVKGEFMLMAIAHNLNILYRLLEVIQFIRLVYGSSASIYMILKISKIKNHFIIIIKIGRNPTLSDYKPCYAGK